MNETIENQPERIALPLHQSLLRFATVGVINTLTDIGIYTFLQTEHVNLVVANTCSTSVGLVVSFLLNRRYTFQAHGSALRRQLARFFPITLFGLWVLQPITIYLVKHFAGGLVSASFIPHGLHGSILIPKLAATVISLIWNYIWYSRYVFA